MRTREKTSMRHIVTLKAQPLRRAFIIFTALLFGLPAMRANGSEYPSAPIRIVVPFTAGGVSDIVARTLSNDLSQHFNTPVIVENRPGASATIGTRYVAGQAPDGYTLLLGTNGTHGTNVSTFANLGYDPIKDFEPIAVLGETSLMILVNNGVPANNLQEFVSWLKSGDRQVSYGSTGNGGGVHLITENFIAKTGIEMQHVPYKGSSPALADLMGGHIDVMFDNIASSLNLVKTGKLKALAVTGSNRSSLIPELPTVTETGVADFVAGNWLGIYAPAGTPQPTVNRLNEAINSSLRDPSVIETLTNAGFASVGGSVEEFRDRTRLEIQKWAEVTQRIGLQPQ